MDQYNTMRSVRYVTSPFDVILAYALILLDRMLNNDYANIVLSSKYYAISYKITLVLQLLPLVFSFPSHRNDIINNKQFDGGQSTEEEKSLRDFYKRLLNFTINSNALAGNYQDVHSFNREKTENYTDKVLSFARWSDDEKLIVVSNFDANSSHLFELELPENLITTWNLKDGKYQFKDVLYQNYTSELIVSNGKARIKIQLQPLESFILKLQ
jgi:hypothetical protein